jgi:hypothetical protein
MNKYLLQAIALLKVQLGLFWALSNKIPSFFAEARNLSLSERQAIALSLDEKTLISSPLANLQQKSYSILARSAGDGKRLPNPTCRSFNGSKA